MINNDRSRKALWAVKNLILRLQMPLQGVRVETPGLKIGSGGVYDKCVEICVACTHTLGQRVKLSGHVRTHNKMLRDGRNILQLFTSAEQS